MYSRALAQDTPAWLRETCEAAAGEAAALLGLGAVKIRWHRTDYGRKLGWVDRETPGEINLVIDTLATKTAYQARAMVLHEARHLWQQVTGHYLGRREGEHDAQQWAFQQTGVLVDLVESYEV
jgi:hypothetical protein